MTFLLKVIFNNERAVDIGFQQPGQADMHTFWRRPAAGGRRPGAA